MLLSLRKLLSCVSCQRSNVIDLPNDACSVPPSGNLLVPHAQSILVDHFLLLVLVDSLIFSRHKKHFSIREYSERILICFLSQLGVTLLSKSQLA